MLTPPNINFLATSLVEMVATCFATDVGPKELHAINSIPEPTGVEFKGFPISSPGTGAIYEEKPLVDMMDHGQNREKINNYHTVYHFESGRKRKVGQN